MTTTTAAPKSQGLAGVTAGETAICSVGQGKLVYRGYAIDDLAEHACFEETAFLLLVGHKPDAAELSAFKDEIVGYRRLPVGAVNLIKEISKAPGAVPMDVLRTVVSYLGQFDPNCQDISPAAEQTKSRQLLAQIPTIIGHMQNVIDGRDIVEPDDSLGHAANLLWMMTGQKPSDESTKVVDVSLTLYAEHDFNASTFASRVIAGTNADMHGAVTGAIAALKGPLHGGANEKAMDMLLEVGAVENVDSYMANAFATKAKIMGFGHRVYKQGDHRAPILHALGREAAEKIGPEATKWFDVGEKVQKIMLDEKDIHPNVDFPCGMTYYALGIPVPQYTPLFVAARITGWCAHILEQHATQKLIRPIAEYVGPENLKW